MTHDHFKVKSTPRVVVSLKIPQIPLVYSLKGILGTRQTHPLLPVFFFLMKL